MLSTYLFHAALAVGILTAFRFALRGVVGDVREWWA